MIRYNYNKSGEGQKEGKKKWQEKRLSIVY